jgi:molybdate transport system substrate-binding protein
MSTALRGISSMATRQVLADLVADYARQSGRPVAIESVGGVDAARRVQAGEHFDFAVLASDAIERLIATGHVLAGSRVDLVRSPVAIAVHAGAPRPGIGSEDAMRQTVMAARSLAYSTGPSGVHLAGLFERWGIAGQVRDRLVQAPPGVPVGTLVARGEAELGFQQLSELMHLPGIEVLGTLPPDIAFITTFAAGVCTGSPQADAVRAMLAFMSAPPAADAKRRHGMEPA